MPFQRRRGRNPMKKRAASDAPERSHIPFTPDPFNCAVAPEPVVETVSVEDKDEVAET